MNTLPIIALTENVISEDLKKYREAGFVEHVAKPCEIKELFTKIKSIFRFTC